MNSRHPISVAHVTAERGFSGGEMQVFLLMEGLRKRGHHNLLLCPAGSRSEQEARRRGLDASAVQGRNHWSPRGVMSIERQLRANEPDLVHFHSGRATWLGGIAAWRLGLPGLATRRMDRGLARGWRTRFVYGTALCRAVAISEAVARHLSEGGVRDEIIRIVPSAVEPGRIHPQRAPRAVRRSLGADLDTACLLVVAALIERKGIDVLIEALARLAEDGLFPTLWVAGDGPQREVLERLARGRGIASRVHFLGYRDDVPDLLGACDVFVLPSRREGLGVAALEAMALARPVVATRVGGLGEAVIHERTGLLVPPDDAEALRAALARLLREPALRQRLGAAGPQRIAQRYHAEAMVDAYERLYFEMLQERPRV